jgi:hypothetical protein
MQIETSDSCYLSYSIVYIVINILLDLTQILGWEMFVILDKIHALFLFLNVFFGGNSKLAVVLWILFIFVFVEMCAREYSSSLSMWLWCPLSCSRSLRPIVKIEKIRYDANLWIRHYKIGHFLFPFFRLVSWKIHLKMPSNFQGTMPVSEKLHFGREKSKLKRLEKMWMKNHIFPPFLKFFVLMKFHYLWPESGHNDPKIGPSRPIARQNR